MTRRRCRRIPAPIFVVVAAFACVPGRAVASSADDPPAPASPPCGWADSNEVGPRQRPLVEARRAKCARLKPYDPTFLEGQILSFEKAERPAINAVNFLGVYPRIQAVDHRSQAAGGFRFWQPDIGRSPLDVTGSAFWSIEGFRFFEGQAGILPHRGKGLPRFSYRMDDVFELPNVRVDDDTRFILYGSFSHRWAPKFDFYGLGPDSLEEDHSDFSLKDTLVEGIAGYRLFGHLTLSARAGYYRVSTGPGEDDGLPQVEDVFAPSEIPGFGSRIEFLRVGATAVVDRRDVPMNPHRGGLISVQWLGFDQRGGSGFSFNRFAADGRLYLPLGHPQRVLALRAYGSVDDPRNAESSVPFYLQPFLGSSHTLRAYASQRYRGEKLGLAQAEYRIEASPGVEVALFVDSATVARSGEDLGDFQTDGGVGLRFKTHEQTLLRFDFAWGGEGFRFGFRFRPSY